MMNLLVNGGALGGHLGGWRHRDAFASTAMQLECMVTIATLAEQGGLDAMFLADGNGRAPDGQAGAVRRQQPLRPPRRVRAGDAVRRLVAAHAPSGVRGDRHYLLRGAVLHRPASSPRSDHLSGGRAAWNLVTTQYVEDSKNFGRDEHFGREERYARARREPRCGARAVGRAGRRTPSCRTRPPANTSTRRACASPTTGAPISR